MNIENILSTAKEALGRIDKVLNVIQESLVEPSRYTKSQFDSLIEIKLMGEGFKNNIYQIIVAVESSGGAMNITELQYQNALSAISTSNEFVQSIVESFMEA